jgi:hypothetical protein
MKFVVGIVKFNLTYATTIFYYGFLLNLVNIMKNFQIQ